MMSDIAAPAQVEPLKLLMRRLRERGDLPIIRPNAAQILRASENSESGASDVARIILHDTGFAAKVLKVANSAYFNRGQEPIGTISRAVVLLGLDMIRQISLGLGFVEMFEQHHPEIDMKRLVADAFAAAVLGQELAESMHHPCPEETFVASLLHSLGRISVAYYMPESYLQIRQLCRQGELDLESAERQMLGRSCTQLALELARRWKLPESVSESLQLSKEDVSRRAVDEHEKMLWASYLSNRITENVFSDRASSKDLDYWLTRLELGINIKPEKGLAIIEDAYQKVCSLAESFEMSPDVFAPADSRRDTPPNTTRLRLVRRLQSRLQQFQTQGKETAEAENAAARPRPQSGEPAQSAPKERLQLEYLRKITWHLMKESDLNGLLSIILEGIHRGIGFERVLLVLCNPERSRFQGRFGVGPGTREFAAHLDLVNDPRDNIFAKVYADRKPCLVENVDRLGFSRLIPEVLKEGGGIRSFAISPIHAGTNVIGFFYADNAVSGVPIRPPDYDAFLQFCFQANLCLERLSRNEE